MLDRIAATTGLAAKFSAGLQAFRKSEQQLADIASLGSEEDRDDMQRMIEEVSQYRVALWR